jgi:hypothetical protein
MAYKPEPLLRRHVGVERCSTWKKLKLCVKGRKYGFSAELVGKSGSTLPVPTGDARSPEQAMRNAKKFLDGVVSKNN